MPCSPEELTRLAEGLSEGHWGSLDASAAVIETTPASPSTLEARHKMGLFANIRTSVGAFGPEFHAKVLNPIFMGLNKAYNTAYGFQKKFNDALEPLKSNFLERHLTGLPYEKDVKVQQALAYIDRSGRYIGPAGAFEPDVIEAATKLRRDFYNPLFREGGLDPDTYIEGYYPLVLKRRQGILGEAADIPEVEQLRGRLGYEDIRFVHELERRGGVQDWEPTASGAAAAYLEAFTRAKMIAPMLKKVEEEAVNPYFGHNLLWMGRGKIAHEVNDAVGYKHWLKLKENILGGTTDLDRYVARSLDQVRDLASNVIPSLKEKVIDESSLFKAGQLISKMFYSGVLGSPLGTRPASLVRHLFRIVPTFSEFGAYDTLQGFSKVLEGRGEYITSLRERGLLSSPWEGIVQQVDTAGKVGRTISNASEASLKLFSASDVVLRAATAGASESRFARVLESHNWNSLVGGKDIREQVMKLVEAGKIDEARDMYVMHQMTNLEYTYGKANRPQALQGMVKSLAGILTAYPLNTWELYNGFRREAQQGISEAIKTGDYSLSGPLQQALPALRQIGVVSAALMAGKEFLNADLSSIFLHGMLPSSAGLFSTAADTYNFGRTNVEWLVGNLFGLGETDFARYEREQASKHFARDVSAFVPTSVFWQDMSNVVESGNLEGVLKMMGVKPLAEDINAENRAKARIKAREKASERSAY